MLHSRLRPFAVGAPFAGRCSRPRTNSQPTLIVDDVKSGAGAGGAVALWIGPGTVARFRDLRVSGSGG